MFEFFWVRAASVWIAVLYIVMGLLLLAFPGASSTLFVWVLAAGAAAYGASHLWRYIQGRRSGGALSGDLFLSILPAAFAGFALLWPEAVLSVLPLVLGSLLLVDGVGKLPLALTAIRDKYPNMVPMILASVIPILLGILIVVNPFQTAKIVVMVFGLSLVADGASDFLTVLLDKRSATPAGK